MSRIQRAVNDRAPRGTEHHVYDMVGLVLVTAALAPGFASAQSPTLFDAIDETTSRPASPPPDWVADLEARTAMPPCRDRRAWGRSHLDGGLASRTRAEGLPCRAVWDAPIRFELGVVGGGLLERGDGGIGGLYAQIGLRYHEVLSVYWQLHLLGGAWDRGDGGFTADASVWNAVLLEVSPTPALSFAAGPSIDGGGGCDVGVAQSPDGCWAAWSYGIATRVTASLFQVDDTGVALVGDFHLSFLDAETRGVVLVGVGFRQ